MFKNNFSTYFLKIGWILGLAFFGLLLGCQTSVYVTEPPSDPIRLKKILVLPFYDASLMSDNTAHTRCPVCGRALITAEIEPGAAGFLTDKSVELLKRYTDYQIVRGRSSAALDPAIQTTVAARQLLADKGREKDTDAVLVGFVYRFKERVGKAYGVESPASVAFDMHLIRVADSRTLWSARFDETQQSLGDNLFRLGSFLSRGGRWVTAEELATSGLEQIFEKFPK